MTIHMLLVVLLVLVLLLPYRWSRGRTFGGATGYWQSVLYTYTYGPGYEHVEFNGLRRLQLWMLFVLTTVVGRLQPELVAWIVEAVRQTLGL